MKFSWEFIAVSFLRAVFHFGNQECIFIKDNSEPWFKTYMCKYTSVMLSVSSNASAFPPKDQVHIIILGDPRKQLHLLTQAVLLYENAALHFIPSNETVADNIVFMNLELLLATKFSVDINFEAYIVLRSASMHKSLELFEMFQSCPVCHFSVRKLCEWNPELGTEAATIPALYRRCGVDFYRHRENLNSYQLKSVAVTASRAMTDVSYSPPKVAGGYFGSSFLLLLNQFNARYELRILEGYKYGSFVNGSWNGKMGYLSRGDVDMSTSHLSMAWDRLEFVDFSMPLTSIGRRIYIKKVEKVSSVNWTFYSAPFSNMLHLAVYVWAVTMGLLLGLVQRRSIFVCSLTSFDIVDSMWMAFSSLCQKGTDLIPFNGPSKVVYFIIGFVSLTIFGAYSATLISQLSVPPPIDVPFKGLQDFVEKSVNWKGGVVRNDLTQGYMQKACPELLEKGSNPQCELLVKLWNKIIKPEEQNLPNSFVEGMERVLAGKFAFIAGGIGSRETIIREFSQDRCKILEMDGEYISTFLSFGFRKNSPYKRLVDNKLHGSGILQKLRKDWIPSKVQCNDISSGFTEATIYDVGFAPLVWLFGILISLCVVIFEYLFRILIGWFSARETTVQLLS